MELGRIGIWSVQLGEVREGVEDAAAELDQLGYGALWMPNGPAMFERARELLDATRRVVVATGIASIWTHPAAAAAAAHRELTESHPGRFLLGLGVSHQQIVDKDQPGRYSRPVERMQEYLDALDSGPNPVPREERVLAALGPRMLALARDRSAGAHLALVTVDPQPHRGAPPGGRRPRVHQGGHGGPCHPAQRRVANAGRGVAPRVRPALTNQ